MCPVTPDTCPCAAAPRQLAACSATRQLKHRNPSVGPCRSLSRHPEPRLGGIQIPTDDCPGVASRLGLFTACCEEQNL